ARWDVNRDGLIDLAEYTAYFQARMQRVLSQRGLIPDSGPGEEERRRPVVYRYGQLPPELPERFTELATDQDGRIGVYEWRVTDWPVGEFERLDLNRDGFLTIDEMQRGIARAHEQGQPLGLLARRGGGNGTYSSPGLAGLKPDKKDRGFKPDKKEKGPKPDK